MTRARIADIIFHAASLSGLTVDDLTGKSRLAHISRARQAAMLVASLQKTSKGDRAYSYPTIAAAFKRDCHSTVLHGCTVAKEMMARDLVYRDFVTSLRGLAASSAPFAGSINIASPPPVQKVVVRQKPTPPPPPPVKQWEVIPMPSSHALRINEDGETEEDIATARMMRVGSRNLAAAMLRERAA